MNRWYIISLTGLTVWVCVGVCTDGAAAMTGECSGLVVVIKAKGPDVVNT